MNNEQQIEIKDPFPKEEEMEYDPMSIGTDLCA